MKQLSALLLFFILHASFATAQARLKEYIVQMPDSVLPLLTNVNRADCIDFREAGMEAKVTNRLGGTTELSALTDDYALWQYTISSQVEMKLLPMNDSTNIICVVHTAQVPEPDSHIAFYDDHWQPLPTTSCWPSLLDTRNQSSSLSTLHLTLSPEVSSMKAEFRKETYEMKDENAVMTPTTETYWYDWKEGTFTLR